MEHMEHQEDEGSTAQLNSEGQQGEPSQEFTAAAAASLQARQRRRIAQLEEKLEVLEAGRALKERQSNQYMAQGRAIRRVVSLFDNVEDLVTENDRRYELTGGDEEVNVDQDRLQVGYVTLTNTLPWFHKKAVEMEYDEYVHMIKMLRQGADGARGCSAQQKLTGTTQYRTDGHIVTDLSFPAFLYDKYTANPDDLEEGLFKGKILLQAYKAVFTSPSSAKVIEGDGDGADVIQNNRLAKKSAAGVKVKKHVAQIIKMRKVTPRSIAYISCQVRFTLSSVTSWRSVDGDFDYVQFWRTIVDFFERAPGREAHRRVDRLLEWWTRKVFGRNYRDDISTAAKENITELQMRPRTFDELDPSTHPNSTILAPVCGYAYVRSMSWIHTKLQMHPRTFDELDPSTHLNSTILAPVRGYAYVRSMSWIHTELQMHPRTFDELDPSTHPNSTILAPVRGYAYDLQQDHDGLCFLWSRANYGAERNGLWDEHWEAVKWNA
ncbi:uncharacterized protein F5891DRAFT_985423 [Suillus fuscotomentosus]|uniref:Uncharacterized protein n=1 Tax=Suillus fuscotomentosus TaxID=1912939 RepID=A0AAD4DUG1_9AGAM|nr:uncharacterized protein F5891DRAFT_985423 [Suillus fuscotomentosus]KAG1893977.1 hypothetical protein F5891DRAFT_985423 [Suillus fuscotomentosus]